MPCSLTAEYREARILPDHPLFERESDRPGDKAPRTSQEPDLIPARMLNEYSYCPRLAYLEWVQGEWADSVDTLEGAH
jgi:hypothetical protein